MVQPFWMINSSLLIACLIAIGTACFLTIKVPERIDIEPVLYSTPKKEQHVAINIRHIYEHDLFGTFKKEIPQKPVPEKIALPPEPPMPQKVTIPEKPKNNFLEPLNITLKGIIISTEESKNHAFIADNKTTQEGVYKIGDTIQDAQLIRIFNNKIILLRNNGQQEVLYLREQDAKADPSFTKINDWNTSIKRISGNQFQIFPFPFLKRIETLPHFIEMLNLTTAYQKGVPIGLRIGNSEENSVGFALGLLPGDIITSIYNIPSTTILNRVEIYNKIIKMELPGTIDVLFLRNGRSNHYTYTIDEMKHEKIIIKSTKPSQLLPGAASNKNNAQEGNSFEQDETSQFDYNDNSYDNYDYDNDDMFAQLQKEIRTRDTHNMISQNEKPINVKKEDNEKA